ncbi:hypothetical protein, partial [Mycolicibacterium sp. CBMA 295]|uniref:hypothetical protein n=1 Tax=Mycolicibacterium sp. CBMA 295 TaxID=2606605 RepID=UPI001EE3E70D
MRAATTAMMTRWDASPVVLRVDGDFAAALIDSHTDVELFPDWLDRFPYKNSLPRSPLRWSPKCSDATTKS